MLFHVNIVIDIMRRCINVFTQERYMIIKKWGNHLFSFHGGEINKATKGLFAVALQKMLETKEFNVATDKTEGTVTISFALGGIVVKTKNQRFDVSMDAETKKRLQAYQAKFGIRKTSAETTKELTKETPSETNSSASIETENPTAEQSPSHKDVVNETKKDEKPRGRSIFMTFVE